MRVLLGVGGSSDSVAALDRTIERAEVAGDELTVAILDNPKSERSVERVTELARDRLDESPIDATIKQLNGDPGPALVELADKGDYEQVVLGGGKRSPMGKLTVGPIAEFVLMNGEVTVTLVR